MGRHSCLCQQRPCVCGADAPGERIAMRFTPESFVLLLELERRWFETFLLISRRRGEHQVWQGAARMMLATRLNTLAN